MASYFTGRSGSRSGGFSAGRTGSYGGGKTAGTGAKVAPAYKSVTTSFNNKIASYRTLMSQCKGPAKWQRPTPATLNSFANWINKGAIVQTVSGAQVSKWAKSANKTFNNRTASPTTCKNVLQKKFGKTTIKAVCRTKNGGFMVVTSPTRNGKPFCFPK